MPRAQPHKRVRFVPPALLWTAPALPDRFEQRHAGGHRWRYELEPVAEGTKVTETFDWSTALAPPVIELLGIPRKHPNGMRATLERLGRQVTSG